VSYFSKYTMTCTEFFGNNKSYIIRRNVVVLLRFENRQFFFAALCITCIGFYSNVSRVVYKGAQNQNMRENKFNNLHAPVTLYMHTSIKCDHIKANNYLYTLRLIILVVSPMHKNNHNNALSSYNNSCYTASRNSNVIK